MKRVAGFTLLEVMVVVVLIGLTAALIVPEMKGTFQSMLLRSTARDLVSACALASSQAITLHQTHRLRLDRASGHYLVEPSTRRTESGGALAPPSDIPGAKGELDSRIKIELRKPNDSEGEEAPEPGASRVGSPAADLNALSFYADGTAEAGELVLRDMEGFGVALRINPTTARVRLMELDPR